MKHRSLGKMFLLTIVTFGIYRLYWFAKTRREMMSQHSSVKIPHVIWLVAPLALVVLSVFFLIGSGMMSQEDTASASGTQIAAIVSLYIAIIAIVPLMAIWLWKYSKGVELVTHEKMSFAISLLILLLVPDGIDILIMQDAFNKIASQSHAPSMLAPSAPFAPHQ